jgi:hypothetical protein
MPLLKGSFLEESQRLFKEDVMRIVSKLLLVFSLAGLITACPTQPAAVGKLEVKITGLPSGATPNVTVTGPNAFSQAITKPGGSSTAITDLLVGSYKVAATDVTVDSKTYVPTVTGSPANVTADTTSSVNVVYGALRTITGKVVNGVGQPITAASLTGFGTTLSVKLLGSTTTIPVDANGNFTMAEVPATYSLAVLLSNQYARSATIYQGLTRANPTLTILQGQFGGPSTSGPTSATSVIGKITGGLGFNAASSASTVFTLALPTAVRSAPGYSLSVNPVTGEYSTGATWKGTDTVTGTIHALQFSTDINGKITAFGGYGQQAVKLTPQPQEPVIINPGDPLPQPTFVTQDVALTAVTSGSIKGTITWPVGLTTPKYEMNAIVLLNNPNTASLPLYRYNSSTPKISVAPTGFDQPVPLIDGAKYLQVLGIGEDSGPTAASAPVYSTVFKLVTPQASTNITVPDPISLTLPAADADKITASTPFSWSKYPGGIHIFTIGQIQTQIPTTIQVITESSSTTFPALGLKEFDIPKGGKMYWTVSGAAPFSNVDAATDAGGLMIPTSSSAFSAVADLSFSTSTIRTFTTAP